MAYIQMQCKRRQLKVDTEQAMKVVAVTLATLMLASTPALSAGFERVTVPDPDGPPLEAGIWYPSEAAASLQSIGLYQQTVAPGGAVAGRR
jgi:hypothetical protein